MTRSRPRHVVTLLRLEHGLTHWQPACHIITCSSSLSCCFKDNSVTIKSLSKFEVTKHFIFPFLLWASFHVCCLVMMPNKLRRKCFRGRQRQPEQVHAGLMNARQQDCYELIHASAPSHQRLPWRGQVRWTAAAREMALMRVWHACSEQS